MGGLDIFVFLAFVASVIGLGLWKSRKTHEGEKSSEDYFLAGRGLSWWLVGFSLIAANISTEQFVGMSGKAADWLGMAIASYEWMAAITLVVVAFIFLPTFLRCGIYTIPEFLEHRYNKFARTVMAAATLIILVGVPTASVIFSGAKVICVNFQGVMFMGLDMGSITVGCWIIGLLAAIYVFIGGLGACAWADLIQGSALILGGVIIAVLAFNALDKADPNELLKTSKNDTLTVQQLEESGPIDKFVKLNDAPVPEGKLHMVREIDDPEIPWTALVLGLWIPNFFYWGLNQYIMQRTLGSKSLAQGQKGIVFAAGMKLIIPFIVVIPGILAFNLYNSDLNDQATIKNDKVLVHFTAQESMVFNFNNEFVETAPEKANELFAYNAGILNVELPVVEKVEDVKVNALALSKANSELVKQAEEANIDVSDRLIGYDYDSAFPTLLKNLLPVGNGLKGFVLAAIFGAVVSSLASMLNSASTIFSMDIYTKINKKATNKELITVGRICVLVFVLIAIFIAPNLGKPQFGGIFTFIQEFQGFISPGILTIFLFGLLWARTPRFVGTVGLFLQPCLYGLFKFGTSIPIIKNIGIIQTIAAKSFLDRMAYCMIILVVVLAVLTLLFPMKDKVTMPHNVDMDMTSSKGAKIWGIVVCALTLVLYAIFW
ncbi:MAG: sodium/solute symporter [Phycisphaerae bacterium]|nr:sodium/solute symporter [Phycisphaerae bacterium]